MRSRNSSHEKVPVLAEETHIHSMHEHSAAEIPRMSLSFPA